MGERGNKNIDIPLLFRHLFFLAMLSHFAQVLTFLIVGFLFIFVTLLFGRLVRPKNPNPVKSESYECGEPAIGAAWINFNIRFYVIALIFLVFDVEIALIFPVAAVFKDFISQGMGSAALIELIIFISILLVGLIYVWAKRDLEWIKNP